MKTPFISLVSKSWAQSSGNLDVQMVADLQEFIILSLHILNHDLDLQDLGYLADHKDVYHDHDEAAFGEVGDINDGPFRDDEVRGNGEI
jgi:hypothetical protein